MIKINIVMMRIPDGQRVKNNMGKKTNTMNLSTPNGPKVKIKRN